jgi:hypothetical protein
MSADGGIGVPADGGGSAPVRKGGAVLAAVGHAVDTRCIVEGTKALCLQDIKAATATDVVEATSPPRMPSRLAVTP